MTNLFLVTASGSLLGHLKIYNQEICTVIVKACVGLLFPLFSFLVVGQTVSAMPSLDIVWQLQLSTVLTCTLGLGLGLALVMVLSAPKSSRYTLVSVVAFSNMGNIPVMVAEGACSEYGPLYRDPDCNMLEGYAMTQCIAFNIMVWGIAYSLILKDARSKVKEKVVNFFSAVNDDKASLMSETFDGPALPDKVDCRTVIQNAVFSSVPLWSILGVVLGVLPGVQEALFNDDAPLRFLINGLLSIGYLGIILSQQVLGCNIYNQFIQFQPINPKLLLGVILSRLVIVPLVAQFFIYIAHSEGYISLGFAFICMLGSASPPGVATMTINQLLGVGVETSSVAFMFLYPISIVTLTLHCYLFFALNPLG